MALSRDYYYEVDDRGVLTLNGVVQDDPWFIDFFYRRLAPTASPHYPDHPYVSRCGDEMNYLRAADTPIVFTQFDGERLFYAHSLSVPFYPDRLTYNADGVLYYASPVGGVGRIVPQVAMELSRWVEPWGPFYGFRFPESKRVTPFISLTGLDRYAVLYPKRDNACVACGANNPYSLALSFLHDTESGIVSTFVRPDERFQGSLGITHGGFVSLLLDECMGKCLSILGLRAPTATLTVNFRQPMQLDEEHEVRAWIELQQGRKNSVRAEIRRQSDGATIADGSALFITIGSR